MLPEFIKTLVFVLALVVCLPLTAAVLPEDRADVLYHRYDGGGIEVEGPSVLVRKQVGQSTSVTGNYYVDSITSASIDVVTTASPYEEERTEYSAGVDYLHEKTTLSAGYKNSEENDFTANTAHFSFSQDVFADLTTISLGYSKGWDVVKQSTDAAFSRDVDRQSYRFGWSQVLTKNSLLDLTLETITDTGYLNNPYRSVRYQDGSGGYLYEAESYPDTRTSNALAVRGMYYLPYRATLRGEYRFFTDTWGIEANSIEVGYTHPLKGRWILETRYRVYEQTRADFYRDLFSRSRELTYRARDKELSSFTSQTIGFGMSYDFLDAGWKFIDRGSVNFSYDYMMFDYDDFRDVRVTGVTPGTEPLYSFSANVVQLYFSIWY